MPHLANGPTPGKIEKTYTNAHIAPALTYLEKNLVIVI